MTTASFIREYIIFCCAFEVVSPWRLVKGRFWNLRSRKGVLSKTTKRIRGNHNGLREGKLIVRVPPLLSSRFGRGG